MKPSPEVRVMAGLALFIIEPKPSRKMRNRDIKIGNYVGYKRGSRGYLKRCYRCGRTIYMWQGNDGKWRPYESWIEQNANEGEWIIHQCDVAFERVLDLTELL